MGAASGSHHNPATIAGDTLSGTASGAAIGGAPGAVIGAAGGFLAGLLTGDSPDPLAPPAPPPQAPDVADAIAERAQVAQQARLMASGSGNFLTGPLGDTSKAAGYAPTAGGK